jgi:hypothetical protein
MLFQMTIFASFVYESRAAFLMNLLLSGATAWHAFDVVRALNEEKTS